MKGVYPQLRYLIACEDIQRDPVNPRRVSLVNLISTIRSLETPPFPLLYRELCVFAQLTECRGPANVSVRIADADSGQMIYSGPRKPWRIELPSDPLEVVGIPFRILNVEFPNAGLYWIQFWYNDVSLQQQPLLLR